MLLQGLEIVQTKLHMSGRDQRTCGPAIKTSSVQVYQRHWPSHHRLCRLSHQQGKKSLIAEKTMATIMVTISCGDDPRKFILSKSGKSGALPCTRHLLDQFKLFAGIDTKKNKVSVEKKPQGHSFPPLHHKIGIKWWQGAKGLAQRRQKYCFQYDWLAAANYEYFFHNSTRWARARWRLTHSLTQESLRAFPPARGKAAPFEEH